MENVNEPGKFFGTYLTKYSVDRNVEKIITYREVQSDPIY